MRKGRIAVVLVIAASLMMMVQACGKVTSEGEHTKNTLTWEVVKYITQPGAKIWKTKYFQGATYEGVQYCFEKEGFVEKEAKKFLKREANLISYADKVFGKKRDGDKIYVNEMIDGRNIRADRPITYDTLWMALNRIHKVNGLETYGLFQLYCKENHFIETEEDSVSDEELATYFSKKENLFLLDFTVPMIDRQIFTEEQVKMTKAAVESFASWYVKQYSLEAYEKLCKELETCDKQKLADEKNAWLQSLGCKETYQEFSKVYLKLTDYVYSDMDTEDPADYEIDRPDAVWIMYSKGIKKTGYQETIRKYVELEPLREKDFSEARAFLEDYRPHHLDKVRIVMMLHREPENGEASFHEANVSIRIYYGWELAQRSLLHEYIHYLTRSDEGVVHDAIRKFCIEGVAVWLASLQLENREYNSCRQWMADIAERDEREEHLTADSLELDFPYMVYNGYLASVREKVSKDKKRKASEGLPYAIDINSMFTYSEYGVILKYVYETYGMEKTMELLRSDADFEKVLGKSLDYIYFEAADYAKKEMKRIEAKRGEKE